MQTQQQLHKYVVALAAVLALFIGSYGISLLRVSQSSKFSGFHLKSLPLDLKSDVQPMPPTR